MEENKKEISTEEKNTETVEEPKKEKTSYIFIIKVTTNKEDRALELISDKVRKKELSVYALARPHGLRGYIFLEARDRDTAEEAAYNLPYVKGIIGKTVEYEEIKNMIEPVMEEINIEKGDIVEIIGEPFKKEKAKVVRVDKTKGEVIVTLLAAVVPIPVTVKLDNVKVIRRDNEVKDINSTEDNDDDNNSQTSNDEPKPLLSDDYEEQVGGLIPDDY